MRVLLFSINATSFNFPPYGSWCLKAFLRHNENEIKTSDALIVDVISFTTDDALDEIATVVASYKPDLIGASHYIWNDAALISLLPILRRAVGSDPCIIVGGPHCEVSDPRLMRALHDCDVDALVVGEGEQPLLEISKRVSANSSLSEIPGVLTRSATAGYSSYQPQSYGRGDLDYLPFPYATLPEFAELSLKAGSFQIETSRGCPYKCTFCDQGHKFYRTYSKDRLVADLSLVAAHRPKHIDFLDGTFNLSSKRITLILSTLLENGFEGSIHAEVKPDTLTEPDVTLMKRARFRSVELGFQSTHEDTLATVKRGMKRERIEASVRLLKEHSIDVYINTIIGLPGETVSMWFDSIDYCYRLGDINIESNLLKILPNTEMFEEADALGLAYSRNDLNALISTRTMSANDIRLARSVNRLISLLWNKREDKSALRRIIQDFYSDSLTNFMLAAIKVASGVLFSTADELIRSLAVEPAVNVGEAAENIGPRAAVS
jgi:radical SAM superfamily enzyme YgiQ (UPF0313 family)